MQSLIVDNFDSFTYNIYQLLAQVNGVNPTVITNNELSWDEINNLHFDNIILSPGPGNPSISSDFGVCKDILLNANIPVLGICLGHQGLAHFYGAKIIRSSFPFHGRVSEVYHQKNEIFNHIPSPFQVVRYHSLIVDHCLFSDLEIIAYTADNLIMAIKHRFKPFWGVQFHPESICSEYGKQLLINFKNITQKYHSNQARSTFINKNSLDNKPEKSIIQKEQKLYKIYSKKLDFFVESPSVFQTLYAKSSHSFWLDSSMVAEDLSRFSYMGDNQGKYSFSISYNVNQEEITVNNHNKTRKIKGNIFDFLQDILAEYSCDNDELPCNFNGGLVGYFGYELKALLDNKNFHQSSLPDAYFIFVDRAIIFDHLYQEIYLIFLDKIDYKIEANLWFNDIESQLKNIPKFINQFDQSFLPEQYKLSRNQTEYLENITTCLEKIKAGESYEICLTNRLYFPSISNPLNYYLQLRNQNPVPYSAFFKTKYCTIACSSPERFLLLDKDGILESKPIKGTTKRGKTKEEDLSLKNSLQLSEKERAENLMIVDLLRHDFGRVCQIGSVTVPKLMSIESYSTVHQMVSTIQGKIQPQVNAIDCIKSCFPGGSMTGAPKKRTMEIIDELETEARGIYSGSLGFLSLNGTMDLNIIIRTAIITPDYTSIGVGGAITILSSPEKEFDETLLKAKALIW